MTTSNNPQPSQPGPIAQQLAKIQSNGHQAPSNGQQLPIGQPPKKRSISWEFVGKTWYERLMLIFTFLAALGAIAIPVAIGVGTTWFSYQQNQTNEQIAQDQQRAVILQTYTNNIQDLLLNHNLLKSKSSDEVAVLARARTLTALRGLDSGRRAALLSFLYESGLIFRDQEIIDLSDANLQDAELNNANLRAASLGKTDLSGAKLSYADLFYTNLSETVLVGADLHRAGLSGSILWKAQLANADLRGVFGGCISREDIFDFLPFAYRIAELKLTHFKVGQLICTDLSGANLSGANLGCFNEGSCTWLNGSDLSCYDEAVTICTNLSDAIMNGAELDGVNMQGANLRGASLENAQLIRADLSCYDPGYCTDLSGANLSEADLGNSNLWGANLSGANLKNADLSGADLLNVQVTNKQLAEVKSLRGATMPDGSKHP